MLDSFFAKEEDKKLFKNLVIVLTSVLILLVAALFVNTLRASKFVGLDVTPANTLSFTGVAELNAVPDIATISFSVEETNKDVKVAQDVVSEKISAILNALESEDVEEKDIQTQQYSVYPQYRYNPENGAQTIIGQVVSQNVTVKVRDIESVPEVLTLLATNEVKNINGPSFDIDDKDELERQVRQLAIEEAKAQAKELAGDLGVRLVRIVGYNESGSGEVPPMPYYSGVAMDMESTKAAPEIPAGENTIRSSVTITYEVR